MAPTIIFRDLPATFPTEDRFKQPAALGSILVHALMLVTVLVIPLMFTATIPDLRLLTYVVPPPPALAPITVAALPEAPAAAMRTSSVQRQAEAALMAPVAVPEETPRVVDVPVPSIGTAGPGVLGGIPGEPASGYFRGILALPLLADKTPAFLPPAPPPPAEPEVTVQSQESPIRLTEFYPLKTVRVTPPVYPQAAKLARIQGVVLLDLTLNERGNIEEVRLVSGHPLLARAAVDCVRNWIYEPPIVDGRAVQVIIPVRLQFRLAL